MFEFLLMYLLVVLNSTATIVIVCGLAIGIIGHIVWFAHGIDEHDGFGDKNPINKHLKFFRTCLIVSFVMIALVPSRNNIYFIVGGGLAWKALQNEEVQQLPENVIRGINGFFKELGEDVPDSIEALLALKTEAEQVAEQAVEAAAAALAEAEAAAQ